MVAEDHADDTFNICDGQIFDSDAILTETLTQDEKEEMLTIVQGLEGINSRELIDFTSQEFTIPGNAANQRHKQVTSEELDRLANKNSAENTQYQTKWAVTVFKGTMWLILPTFYQIFSSYSIDR